MDLMDALRWLEFWSQLDSPTRFVSTLDDSTGDVHTAPLSVSLTFSWSKSDAGAARRTAAGPTLLHNLFRHLDSFAHQAFPDSARRADWTRQLSALLLRKPYNLAWQTKVEETLSPVLALLKLKMNTDAFSLRHLLLASINHLFYDGLWTEGYMAPKPIYVNEQKQLADGKVVRLLLGSAANELNEFFGDDGEWKRAGSFQSTLLPFDCTLHAWGSILWLFEHRMLAFWRSLGVITNHWTRLISRLPSRYHLSTNDADVKSTTASSSSVAASPLGSSPSVLSLVTTSTSIGPDTATTATATTGATFVLEPLESLMDVYWTWWTSVPIHRRAMCTDVQTFLATAQQLNACLANENDGWRNGALTYIDDSYDPLADARLHLIDTLVAVIHRLFADPVRNWWNRIGAFADRHYTSPVVNQWCHRWQSICTMRRGHFWSPNYPDPVILSAELSKRRLPVDPDSELQVIHYLSCVKRLMPFACDMLHVIYQGRWESIHYRNISDHPDWTLDELLLRLNAPVSLGSTASPPFFEKCVAFADVMLPVVPKSDSSSSSSSSSSSTSAASSSSSTSAASSSSSTSAATASSSMSGALASSTGAPLGGRSSRVCSIQLAPMPLAEQNASTEHVSPAGVTPPLNQNRLFYTHWIQELDRVRATRTPTASKIAVPAGDQPSTTATTARTTDSTSASHTASTGNRSWVADAADFSTGDAVPGRMDQKSLSSRPPLLSTRSPHVGGMQTRARRGAAAAAGGSFTAPAAHDDGYESMWDNVDLDDEEAAAQAEADAEAEELAREAELVDSIDNHGAQSSTTLIDSAETDDISLSPSPLVRRKRRRGR